MDERADGRWADLRTTAAITGIPRADLCLALARGQVGYSLTRCGHDGVLMVSVDDVEHLLGEQELPRHLRIVRDGT